MKNFVFILFLTYLYIPNHCFAYVDHALEYANITSIASGNWNSASTWSGGQIPGSLDNVTIAAGHTVTINIANPTVSDLTIENSGILTMEHFSSSSLTINQNLINNGTLRVFFGTSGRTLNVKQNLTNSGLIDLSKNQSKLELNGTSPQTISGSGSILNNSISRVVFNNSSSTIPNIIWSLNNITVTYALTFTQGIVSINGNWLASGTSTSEGYIDHLAGGIINGTFGVGFASNTVGSYISPNSNPSNSGTFFPFVNANGLPRFAFVERTSANGSGILGMTYNDSQGSIAVSISDNTVPSYSIDYRTNEHWTASVIAGTLTAASFEIAFSAANIFNVEPFVYPRIVQQNNIVGVNQVGTVFPTGQRSGLTLANILSGPFYLGINNNDIPTYSINSGNWGDKNIWSKSQVPNCNFGAVIKSGHTVSVNSQSNNIKYLSIDSGGTLDVTGDINIGCTQFNNRFIINGTFNMSGGLVTVNGNLLSNQNSVFNQSGGEIKIDGNSGSIATSVPTGTSILQFNQNNSGINLTGGIITIVDPHAATAANNVIGYNHSVAGSQTSTSNHTIKLGDGISTQSGGNSVGFRIDTWTNAGFLALGSIEINSGNGSNRLVTFVKTIACNGNVLVRSNSTVFCSNGMSINGSLTIESVGTLTTTNITCAKVESNTSTSLNYIASIDQQEFNISGVLRNLTTNPTANIDNLVINNSNTNGVTMNSPLSVNTNINLIGGYLNTSDQNILTLRSTGTFTGGSLNSYVRGPLIKEYKNSSGTNALNNAHYCPVGKGDKFQPVWVSMNAGSSVINMRIESFTSNSGSSNSGTSLSNLARWSILPLNSASLSNVYLQIGETNITNNNQILHSTAEAGLYSNLNSQIGFSSGMPNRLFNINPISGTNFNPFLGFGQLPTCNTPSDQPTNLQVTHLSPTSFNATFTHPVSGIGRYLIVRYPSASSVITHPVNGVNYLVGGSLGAGVIIAMSSSNSFSQTGLAQNTTYKYVFYNYNSIECAFNNFNTNQPLIEIITTCDFIVPPTGLKFSSRSTNSLGFVYNQSLTENVTHFLDVATNSDFTNILPSYNNYALPLNVSGFTINGLNHSTLYFVRIRAFLNGCPSTYVSKSAYTDCLPATTPYTLNFSSGFECVELLDLNGQNTWEFDPSFYLCNGSCVWYNANGIKDANDILVTRGILLESGKAYQLSYIFGMFGADEVERMDVRVGTERSEAGLSIILEDHNHITVKDSTKINFVPAATDTFYFGFRAYSEFDEFRLYLDDIKIIEMPQCSVSNSGNVAALFPLICGNNEAELSSTGYSVGTGYSYQWQSSTDNFNTIINDIPGATNPKLSKSSLTLNNNYFRLKTTCALTGSEAFSNVVNTVYSNPQILTTVPVQRCGKGTVELVATPYSQNNIRWYNDANSKPRETIGLGSTIESPILTATKSFYASKVDSVLNYVKTIGKGDIYFSWYGESPYYEGYGGQKVQYIYRKEELYDMGFSPGPINSISIVVVQYNNSFQNFSVSVGTTNQNVHVSNSMITGLTTVYNNSNHQIVPGEIVYNFSQPYFWDGRSNLVIQFSFSNNDDGNGGSFSGIRGDVILGGKCTQALLADFVSPIQLLNATSTNSFPSGTNSAVTIQNRRPRIKINGTGACEGTKTELIATYTPPPPLSLSKTQSPICPNATSGTLMISSIVNDFDNYTWTPATNVSGNKNDGYQFSPPNSTEYILTAVQNGGLQCINTISHPVVRNTNPTNITLTSVSNNICANSSPVLLNTIGGTIGGTLTQNSNLYLPEVNVFRTNFGGNKTQSVYLASELRTAGLEYGSNITKISFNVLSPLSPKLECKEFTIRMKHTKANQLTNLESGLVNVFGPLTYKPTIGSGWVDFSFHTPFVWNGIDNIVIEVVHNSKISGIGNPHNHHLLNTDLNRTFIVSEDNVEGGVNGFEAITDYDFCKSFPYVPAIRLFHNVTVNKVWTPSVGLFLDPQGLNPYDSLTTLTANSLYAMPPSTTNYSVVATSSAGCSRSASLILNIEGLVVKNSSNSGFNSLRNVIQCAQENSIITYDQPLITGTVLTSQLTISKVLTIEGLSPSSRPLITIPSNGLSISNGKVLNLNNVDLKVNSTNPSIIGASINVTGQTVIKN